MRITSKGQVTIPIEIRDAFGLLPNTEVEFVSDGKEVRLIKSKRTSGRGAALIKRLKGRGDGQLTTDQILKLTRG